MISKEEIYLIKLLSEASDKVLLYVIQKSTEELIKRQEIK